LQRKFFYLFTYEYCFSHYVAFVFLIIWQFYLLLNNWRGLLIGGFALVWISNIYMSIFGFIRVDMKREKIDADIEELKLKIEKEKCNVKWLSHHHRSLQIITIGIKHKKA